jgi:hypothetical protein
MKFNWNAFSDTRDFIDSSGVISVGEKNEEFLKMYEVACQIYKEEGGGDLTKINVKVYTVHRHLTSRIEFKTFASEKSRILFSVKVLLLINRMMKISKKRIALKVRRRRLHPQNSGLFSLARKSISQSFSREFRRCKINANAS